MPVSNEVVGVTVKNEQVILRYLEIGKNRRQVSKEGEAAPDGQPTKDIPGKLNIGWHGESWTITPGMGIRMAREAAEWVIENKKNHWDHSTHTANAELVIEELGIKDQANDVAEELKFHKDLIAELEAKNKALQAQLKGVAK